MAQGRTLVRGAGFGHGGGGGFGVLAQGLHQFGDVVRVHGLILAEKLLCLASRRFKPSRA
jgi:hypothetical protein